MALIRLEVSAPPSLDRHSLTGGEEFLASTRLAGAGRVVVFGINGIMQGALVVVGINEQLQGRSVEQIARDLREFANELSVQLGRR